MLGWLDYVDRFLFELQKYSSAKMGARFLVVNFLKSFTDFGVSRIDAMGEVG